MVFSISNLVLLAALAATWAEASGFTLTLRSGAASPQGDFGDWWDLGYVVSAAGEFALENQWAVAVDLMVAKSHHNRPSLFGTGSMDHLSVTSFAALVRWMPGAGTSSFVPYLSAGAGSYEVDGDFTDDPQEGAPADARQTTVGFRGGIGFRWRLARFVSIDVSGDYHHVAADRDKIYFDEASLAALQAGLSLGPF